MGEIILKREKKIGKAKRSSVVVSPDTYVRVYQTAQDAGISVERLVDFLLTEALKQVKIVD